MANVRIIMTADMEKLLKDFDKQISKVETMQKLSQKSLQESQRIAAANRKEAMARKEIADEQAKMNQQVTKYRKLIESLKTPTEKWINATAQIEQLRNRGAMGYVEALKAQEAVNASYEKEEEQLRKNSQAYKDELRDKERAKRIIESMQTPMERYKQQYRELRGLLDRGKISQDQFNRAVMRGREELRGALQPSMFASSIKSIGSMAAAYLSVNSAIQLVTRSLEIQREVERKGAAIAESVAGGQAKTLQNLFGVPKEEQQRALKFIEKLDFPDRAGLNEALGRTFSGSAGDLNLTLDVMKEAAEITKFNPEEIGRFAESLIIIAREANLSAKEAVSLLLSTGRSAQVTNLNKTAIGLGPVLGFAAEQGKQIGQGILSAAKEGGAIFAAASLAGVDVKGEPTTTAVITLLQTQAQFYKDLEPNIEKLSREVQKLEAEDEEDKADKIKIRQAEKRVADMQRIADRWAAVPNTSERARLGKAEAELDLDAAKQALQEAIDGSKLSADDRIKLETARKQLQELQEIKRLNPTTILDRFAALRGREFAVGMALEGNPGERRYQEFIQQMYMKQATALDRVADAADAIVVSKDVTEQFNEELRTATDLLATQNAINAGKSDIAQMTGTSINATLNALREQSAEVLNATRFDTATLFGLMGNIERSANSAMNWSQASSDPFRAARGLNLRLFQAAEQMENPLWLGLDRQQSDRMQMQLIERMDRNIELLQQLIETNKELSDTQKRNGRETIEQLKQQRASAGAFVAGAAAAAEAP